MCDALSALIITSERMLASQLDAVRDATVAQPSVLEGNYVLGYIWGFLDAQAMRIQADVNDPHFIDGAEWVHEQIYGQEKGGSLFKKAVQAQQDQDLQYWDGMMAGGTDVNTWVHSGGDVHLEGTSPGSLAKHAKADITGKVPAGLRVHLRGCSRPPHHDDSHHC
jgi:hypothetical protein